MLQLAFGGRYRLQTSESLSSRGMHIDLKGEGWGSQTRIKGTAGRALGGRLNNYGVRMAMELSQDRDLGDGVSLTPAGELGIRWDGGSGDTGVGAELGGSVSYSDSNLGLTITSNARVLLTHESGKKEWGASVSARKNADADERGLSFEVSVSHGSTNSRMQSIWEESAGETKANGGNPQTQFKSEVGYGLYGDLGVYTPYIGINLQESATNYLLGSRYSIGSNTSLNLEMERKESGDKNAEHRIMFKGEKNW